jgi:hypothetical protein
VPLAAKLLKVIYLMLAQLGGALPRELTGWTRYRARYRSWASCKEPSGHPGSILAVEILPDRPV